MSHDWIAKKKKPFLIVSSPPSITTRTTGICDDVDLSLVCNETDSPEITLSNWPRNWISPSYWCLVPSSINIKCVWFGSSGVLSFSSLFDFV